jgi:RHS repeat-associated protein
MGRATETVSATGSVTATQYDNLGRQSRTIDALGNETQYVYDELGRLWKVTDSLGGVTEYGFDERGNRTSVKDAMGNTTTFEYDLNNRLTKETNPLGVETTFTYDATGSRATRTDGNGGTATYSYPSEGRLNRVDFPDGTFRENRYDSRGRKTYEANQDVTQMYELDDLGRIVTYRQINNGGIDKTLRYEFDGNGNRTKMIDAEGGVTIYEYDRNNRLVKVTDSDGDMTRLEYDAAGRRSKLFLGNGVWAAYEYDASSRVTSILYRSRTNQILMGFAYGHDLNGNRLYKRFADGTQETYSYDNANRLVHVTYRDGKFEDFTYDLLGNRVSHNKDGVVTTSTFNAFNQLLTATNTITGEVTAFSWDGNGNLVSETSNAGAKSYLWDFDNRLRQVTMPDGTTSTYIYAASGLRVQKVENGVVTQQLLDGPSVTTEYDDLGTGKGFYLQNPQKIDEFFSATIRIEEAKRLWPIVDALGSVYALTDETGGPVGVFDYRAYGNTVALAGGIAAAFGFSGREPSSSPEPSRLFYYRSRYYNGMAFISPDVLSAPNLYLFAHNNPIVYTDPLGHWAIFGTRLSQSHTRITRLQGPRDFFRTIEMKEQDQTDSYVVKVEFREDPGFNPLAAAEVQVKWGGSNCTELTLIATIYFGAMLNFQGIAEQQTDLTLLHELYHMAHLTAYETGRMVGIIRLFQTNFDGKDYIKSIDEDAALAWSVITYYDLYR